ncbi:MAG TPA: ketopantoate reductase family protein [Candidatus Limnocylindria bacterium]|nr:ketopantoate reductase family protein [Candidatus Limnocylindria bacterium]
MARADGVLVAGAGALGSVFGGLLAAHGLPVTLLGRAQHLDAIARDGLRLDGLFGSHHVTALRCATDARELRDRFATILLTVKSWDTRGMLEAVAAWLTPDGHVICLQNGLGNLETAADVVGRARVLGGRVIFGAEVEAPGRVRVTVIADPVLVGAPDPGDAALDAAARTWAERFAAAGIPSRHTGRLVPELWAKVLYNAALNPAGALLGVPYGRLAADPDTRAIMDAVLDEAFAVAQACGVALAWATPMEYRQVFYGRLVPATADHRSSMLQDLERGRPTEIDAINGYLVRRGAALGVATPVNATLAGLVRARVRRVAEGR